MLIGDQHCPTRNDGAGLSASDAHRLSLCPEADLVVRRTAGVVRTRVGDQTICALDHDAQVVGSEAVQELSVLPDHDMALVRHDDGVTARDGVATAVLEAVDLEEVISKGRPPIGEWSVGVPDKVGVCGECPAD